MKFYRTISIISILSVVGFCAFILVVGRGGNVDESKDRPVVQDVPVSVNKALQPETTEVSTETSPSWDSLASLEQQSEQKLEQQVDSDSSVDSPYYVSDDDMADDYVIEIDTPGDSISSTDLSSQDSTPVIPSTTSSSDSVAASGGSSDSGGNLSGQLPSASISSSPSSGDAPSSDGSFDGSSQVSAPPSSNSGGGGSITYMKDVSVTVLPSTQRLLRDDISAPGEKSVELYCAKNETEAFQLIVTNKNYISLNDIEIYVSDWQGGGAKKPKLSLFREHYIKVNKPSFGLDSQLGWYPDALIPFVDPYTNEKITSGLYRADHASVNSRESQGYWVDVRVDSDVPAGTYTCSMLLTSADRPIGEIPVTFTVWDFELPKQRQFTTWWYGFYNIHQFYGLSGTSGSYYETLMERYRDMAYEHGVYPVYQSSGRQYDAQDGTVIFTSSYHQKIKTFVEKYGTGILIIPTGWLAEDWVPKSDAMILNTLNSYNNMIKANLDKNGNCKHGQYVVYLDEPYKSERIAAVKKIKDLMNTIPDLHVKMMLTGSQYAYDILDSQGHRCADLWICYGQEVIDRHANKPKSYQSIAELSDSFLNDMFNQDAALWTKCGYSVLDENILTYRDFAWYGYTLGMTGGFGWRLTTPSTEGVDLWTESITWTNNGEIWNGNSSHIYPGNSSRVGISGVGGPIASMRLKIWRKACEDFEYFKMLEELTDKETVDAIVSGVVQRYDTYAEVGDYMAAREMIAGLILEKSK